MTPKSLLRSPYATSTIDELVENFDFPVPNYIKIDVDGLENKIIKGSKNILKEESLLSLQVKTNQNVSINKKMIEFIKNMILKS